MANQPTTSGLAKYRRLFRAPSLEIGGSDSGRRDFKKLTLPEPDTTRVGRQFSNLSGGHHQMRGVLPLNGDHDFPAPEEDLHHPGLVGNRHRFNAGDVLVYKEAEERRREEILAGLGPTFGYGPEDF